MSKAETLVAPARMTRREAKEPLESKARPRMIGPMVSAVA
jgi:hypothetical protein